MVERNAESQNSNFLFTGYNPYSQEFPLEPKEDFHLFHQHAVSSLDPPLLPNSSSSDLFPNLSHHHHRLKSFLSSQQSSSYPSPSSGPSYPPTASSQEGNSFDCLYEQQQRPHPLQHKRAEPSLHESVPMNQDQTWGIPSSYDPLTSLRLQLLFHSPNISAPHTTNQPYIYLPPVFSYYPSPSVLSGISSLTSVAEDLSVPTEDPSPSFPPSTNQASPPTHEFLSGPNSLSVMMLTPLDELHRAPRKFPYPSPPPHLQHRYQIGQDTSVLRSDVLGPQQVKDNDSHIAVASQEKKRKSTH
jgi:hypothetical protein